MALRILWLWLLARVSQTMAMIQIVSRYSDTSGYLSID
jgi:hypothetical protein